MPYEELTYKSFCWCLGTTSFRTENFNLKIEQQLRLLNEFWSLHPENDFSWSGSDHVQEKYYEFMQEKGFVKGNAARKDKDAREKTSGLVDMGLIDSNRKLTNVGKALLDISLLGDFTPDNGLMLPKDSFIYFKQLLKTCNNVDGKLVRPMLVLAYLLSKLDYLTLDEATYLMPLCTTKEITVDMVNKIMAIRQGRLNMCENDGVKVLLVTNESELLTTYDKTDNEGKVTKFYTDSALAYKRAKEKTIGDTIHFVCDYENAIQHIILNKIYAYFPYCNADFPYL